MVLNFFLYVSCNTKQPAVVKEAIFMSRHIDAHAHAYTPTHKQVTLLQDMVVAATQGGKNMEFVWCGG